MNTFINIIRDGQQNQGRQNENISEIKFKQSDISYVDELGRHIQKLIDNSKRGDIIELPSETIRVHSLYISKPITLVGGPGTVLEIVGGSIHVDFNMEKQRNQSNNDLSQILQQQVGSSSVSLKRSEVVMISEVQIVFNRNKAHDEAQIQKQEMKQSTGIIIKNKHSDQDPANQVRDGSHLESMSDSTVRRQGNLISCFIVENDSFLEIRDCFIRSVKDLKVIEKEKEQFVAAEAAGGVNIVEQNDVEDCCFAMNISSIVPTSKNGAKPEIEL